MRTYEELINQALEELNNNDDLFVYCVDELDNWNGYADGFRAYDMGELDDLCSGMSLTEFLDHLTEDFNVRDNYFYFSIWGLESTDYKEDLYRDNVDAGDLLDSIIDNYNNLDIAWFDSDFDELIEAIIDFDDSDELEA